MLCFHALLTTYDVKKCTEDVYWVVYIEICQWVVSKSAKKPLIFSPFLHRNHTAGSCAYMRTTRKTLHLATALYYALQVAIWESHRQALHAAQQHKIYTA